MRDAGWGLDALSPPLTPHPASSILVDAEKAREYLDRVASQWDAAAERLRAFVEDE